MADLNAGFKICDNCGRNINISSFLMHEAFCLKNFIKCDICNKSYDKTLKNEHLKEFHSKIKCICGNLIDKYLLDIHQKENCSKRQVECQYCDLSLDSDKIDGHLVVCGSRTELCEKCRKYVLLRDKFAHEHSNCLNREKTPRKSAGQRKQELINANRPSSSLTAFPCEFCNKQFIGFQQLIEHQVFCDLNYPDNEPPEILSNFTDHLDQDLEEMSLNPRGNEIFDEVDAQSEFSLVPCEFCDEYIDFNVFNEHLERCKGMLPSTNEGSSNPESRKSNNAKKVGSNPKTGAQARASNQISNKRFSENIRAPRILPRVIPSPNLVSKRSKDGKSNYLSKKE